jgi:trk system potassium uptake protein TrkH
MSRLAVVLHVLSVVVLVLATAMLLPLGVSVVLSDGAEHAYDEAIVITALAGGLAWLATRRARRELQIRDGFLLVVLVWTVLPAFATLPLMIFLPKLSFIDAYFEAVAAITTTGSTVLSGLDALPASINVWRALLQWIGGMGIIVLTVAILPLLGVGGSQLYKAETPGPMKDTKLTPRITETAKGLWLVYFALTVVCAIAFRWAGMSWLDALIHAFSTMSLGGFSSHDASFGYFNSPAIEIVAIIFMLIAGVNFGTHFLAWRKLALGPYRADSEAGLFIGIMVMSCIGIAWYLLGNHVYSDAWIALRYAAFNVVSIGTTTGYANADFNQWPIFAPFWMLFIGSFATCAGSTGGGIKMVRAQILFKQVFREMLRILHPKIYNPIKLAGQAVENNVIFAVLAFAFVYMSSVSLLTLVLAVSGLDALTSFSAVVACINNIGPGLNLVGPATTYEVLSDFQISVLTFAMVLGRLELFTLLVVLTPAFWRK